MYFNFYYSKKLLKKEVHITVLQNDHKHYFRQHSIERYCKMERLGPGAGSIPTFPRSKSRRYSTNCGWPPQEKEGAVRMPSEVQAPRLACI